MPDEKERAGMQRIAVTENGPYFVEGKVPLIKEALVSGDGDTPIDWEAKERYPDRESYSLCRCGGSSDRPYCDGSHLDNGFKGTETANLHGFERRAQKFEGPGLDLKDEASLCAGLHFCRRDEGAWRMVKRSDDPSVRDTTVDIAAKCSSGRLVACEKNTGEAIEPEFERSIGVVEDPGKGVDGPLKVQGGIPIESAIGGTYETRNRVTLCRCGGSGNKPFCDGTHLITRFDDGDEGIR